MQALVCLPLWVLQCIGRLVAWASILLHTKQYRQVLVNLRLAYPGMESSARIKLAHAVIYNETQSLALTLKCWSKPPSWSIRRIHTVHNAYLLERALASNRGTLAVVPHLGVWEVMSAWLCQKSQPTILYKPTGRASLDALVKRARQKMGARLVPTDASGVKAVFATLKQGGFSIVLPDHVPHPTGGVIAPFFGVPTLSGTLCTKLAQKTNCHLIGLACIPQGRALSIYCYELKDPDLYHKDAAIGARAMNEALQRIISPHKAHYLWSYRRFKHIPDIDNIYALDDATLDRTIHQLKSAQ